MNFLNLSFLLLGILMIAGCSAANSKKNVSSTSTGESKNPKEFWTWFDENKDDVAKKLQSKDNQKIQQTLSEVNKRLGSEYAGVSFLFGKGKGPDAKYHFVATAGGMRENFENVKACAEAAPPMPGWKIIAFKPASESKDSKVRVAEITASASDIMYQIFKLGSGNETGIGVTLYPTGMDESNRKIYQHIAALLLDHTLGEYYAGTKIDSLALQPISKAEKGIPLLPLTKLKEELEKL